MTYTFVYRKDGVPRTAQLSLEDGVDLSEAIYTSKVDVLAELGADTKSPLFAIVK